MRSSLRSTPSSTPVHSGSTQTSQNDNSAPRSAAPTDLVAWLSVSNLNRFADQLCLSFQTEESDPMELYDSNYSVKRWFFRGEAKFTQGVLLGLATIRREGDCSIDEENQQVYLHLVMDKLESHYEFETSIFGMGPKGRCSVKLQNPSIITKMKIVMQPNYKVFLIVEKMEVRLGQMSVSIPNHGFTSAFVRGLMEVLRPKVRTAIRDLVKYYIEEYNKTSMMPFNLVCDFKR